MTGGRRFWVTVLVGAGLIVTGAVVAGSGRPVQPGEVSDIAAATSIVVGTLGVLLALWHLAGSENGASWSEGSDGTAGEEDWTATGDGAVSSTPEYSTSDDPVSGRTLPQLLEVAGSEARDAGSVTAGVESVRPALRETLVEAFLQGGTDREAAERVVETGSWTDDAVAAATLSPAVERPRQSVRERLFAWLFPERALRERVDRTVTAIARTADETLPPVPGQAAPRTVPVANPSLSELQRRVDERLHPAVETDLRQRAADRGTAGPASGDETGDRDADQRGQATGDGAQEREVTDA